MYSFEGKVIWITGSTSGVGKATAQLFLEHGGKVVFHGITKTVEDEEFIAELKEENVLLVEGDVTKKADVDAIVEEMDRKFGRLDVLVNNVGAYVKKAEFENILEEDWDRTIAVNLKSVFLISQAALPLMKKQKEGRIINITSNVARTGGTREGAAYSAAKGGVESLTRALAKQLVDYNILVNGVSPGLVDTPFHKTEAPLSTYESIFRNVPLKRVGQPEEIAGAVLFLASKYASFIVGEIIEVSGGRRIS
jgi:3-oxoacyl-[acyl-carrier protein] reductase